MRKFILPSILSLLFIGFASGHAHADFSPSNSFIITPTNAPTFVENNSVASDNILSQTTINSTPKQAILEESCDCAIRQPLKTNKTPLFPETPVQSDAQNLVKENAGTYANTHLISLNPSISVIAKIFSFYFLISIFCLFFLRPYLRFNSSLSPPKLDV